MKLSEQDKQHSFAGRSGLSQGLKRIGDKLAFDHYLAQFPHCKLHATCGAIWLNIGLFQPLNILFWKIGSYSAQLVSTTKEKGDCTLLQVPGHLQISSDGIHAKGHVRVTDDYLLILKLYLKPGLKSLAHSLCNPFYLRRKEILISYLVLQFRTTNILHFVVSGQKKPLWVSSQL